MSCITLILMSLLGSALSQAFQHECDGTITEAAGFSGSIVSVGACNLTLTGVSGRFSIPGIAIGNNCDISDQLTIGSKAFCLDEKVKDTLIEATNEDKLHFNFGGVNPFTLKYYKGM